eukprot:CFRG4894T1
MGKSSKIHKRAKFTPKATAEPVKKSGTPKDVSLKMGKTGAKKVKDSLVKALKGKPKRGPASAWAAATNGMGKGSTKTKDKAGEVMED